MKIRFDNGQNIFLLLIIGLYKIFNNFGKNFKMRILITGCAGFVGFHLSNALLKNKKNYLIGIDNLNDYYSIKLKRLIFSKEKKFNFYKIDISNYQKLEKIFKNESQA